MLTNSLTKNEEDYLKGLFQLLYEDNFEKVGTNQLAGHLDVTPASANNMLKKLKAKALVDYQRYGKLELTDLGRQLAVELIRKHRLWETFLYEKLGFSWDEVHEVAEQLEHIRSEKLVEKLDVFLSHPAYDPHGDPIPDASGNYKIGPKKTLAEVKVGATCRLAAVKDNSAAFLQYVSELGLGLKSGIKVLERQEFDNSLRIEVGGRQLQVSEKFALNVYVR
jgi:DtxR family transcriptional regulator, Mn-dependent transcriptional regulator